MPVTITVDTSELIRAVSNMGRVREWLPPTVDVNMMLLGDRLVPVMRAVLWQHNYTGALRNSVDYTYNSATKVLELGPKARRGNYDGGIILEAGTRPIPTVPWKPIRAWGLRRGLTVRQSYFALKKIRERGVSSHPFLLKTLQHPGFSREMERAAKQMGLRIAALAIAGDKPVGLAETS